MLSVNQKMLIARALNRSLRLARSLVGRDMLVRCKRGGIEWELDLDEGIDLSIYLLGAFEPRVLRAYAPFVTPGAAVIDIGANIGAHALHFARLAGPDGRVFAIEPTDYAMKKLRRNLDLNPALASRIETRQCFFTADRETAPPVEIPSSWPITAAHHDSRLEALGRPQSAAAAVAIMADDFCAQIGLERLDFVKIDVDGNEHTVLLGFHRTLARFRPTILIELAPFVYDGGKETVFDEFVLFLANLGYQFVDAHSGRPLPNDPAALRRLIAPFSSINALLRPAPQ